MLDRLEIQVIGKDLATRMLKDVSGGIDDLGDKAERADRRSSGALRGIGSSIRGVAGALGPLAGIVAGAFAVDKIVDFTKTAIGSASDLGESLSKNRVLFGQQSEALVRFSQTTATSLGISQNAALAATGTFGNLFDALGIADRPAANMSKRMVQLAADMASFNNANPAEVLDAMRAGLVGETEPLRKFGVNLSDAALRTEALNLGLVKNTKDVLPANVKAQAVYSLMLSQTKAAQGDFARTSGGLANQQRILSAQWADMQTRLGEKLLPHLTRFITFMNARAVPVIEKVAGVVFDLGAKGFDLLGRGIATAQRVLGPFISTVVDFVQH
ncbi:MAG: hypothetical protein M3P51_06745, partial [Chloroflexota bacterium]|nr:hypothetical protein [Chloroflexota bacterium]